MAFRRAPVLGVSGGREGTYQQCIQCSYRERGENALYYIKVYSHPLSRVTPCLPSFANPSMVIFPSPRGSEMFMHFSQLSTLSNAKLIKGQSINKNKIKMAVLTKFLFRDIVVFSGFLRVVGFSCNWQKKSKAILAMWPYEGLQWLFYPSDSSTSLKAHL